MRILVVNPNTTASMTRKIGREAQKVAAKGTTIVATNPMAGPDSIEGYLDEMLSIPGLLGEINAAGDVDACVIACFDDTGLEAARCLVDVPVVGIGESAFHMASLISGRFSVVTTLQRSVPAIEDNLRKYGLANRCARVRASEIPVLALDDMSDTAARLGEEIELAKKEDHAEAIVLGCAGMTDLATRLSKAHGLPVIDGVTSSIKLCEGLVQLGLSTSKINSYASSKRQALLSLAG